ncbi:MAG: hypothetical protein ACREJM_05640, partial [Candidatus Saccharimonadales bacterium]
MVEGNMPLVLAKVEAYIRCFPGAEHLRDDLVGDGMLGLCKAVNTMSENGPHAKANPTGFLASWIQRSIGEVIDREAGNGASVRTMRNRRRSGKEIALEFAVAVALVVGVTFVTYALVAAHLVGPTGEVAMALGLL